jgi:hypothetical protein
LTCPHNNYKQKRKDYKKMKELKKRKNIRIKEYDYSKEGYYFITICVKERKCILSKIKKRVGQDRPLHNNEK